MPSSTAHSSFVFLDNTGKLVELKTEPMGDLMKGVKTDLLTLLPLDDLL
jgi:hypothetical protein